MKGVDSDIFGQWVVQKAATNDPVTEYCSDCCSKSERGLLFNILEECIIGVTIAM